MPSTNLRSSFGVDRAIPYARIHELGGVVAARTTKYLPIPVNPAAKRLLERSTGGLRNSGYKFVVVKGKRGPLLIPAKGKHGPVFALRESVRIPSRPFIRPVVAKHGPAIIQAGQKTAKATLAASGFGAGGAR